MDQQNPFAQQAQQNPFQNQGGYVEQAQPQATPFGQPVQPQQQAYPAQQNQPLQPGQMSQEDQALAQALQADAPHDPTLWTPDRVLLLIYGSSAFIGTFLVFAFRGTIWLLIPIIVGAIQIFTGITGFNPPRSIVASMMKKKVPNEE